MPVLVDKRLDLLDLMHADNFTVRQCADLGVDVALLDARDLARGFGQGDIGVEATCIDDGAE
jgi:hypothetical protein